MKILFFTESLIRGGQERRLLELISYLRKDDFNQIKLVITEYDIFYKFANDLDIEIVVIKRKWFKYDPSLFFKFFRLCKQFNPEIIHAWGKMPTFYSIPTKLICRKPLISNLIANSNKEMKKQFMNNIFYAADIHFSDVILSNSAAGLKAYKINSKKAHVIRNGVRAERFLGEFNKENIKDKFSIRTEYMIVMVACFTSSKDYDLFIEIAKEIWVKRKDVTFVGVGDGPEWNRIQNRILNEEIKNVVLTGDQERVEPIIAASDIGLLCTYSEGISNSVIEYMALGKPVIATDINGGTKEIIIDDETGYCTARDLDTVVSKIYLLLNDERMRITMGEKGKDRIVENFSIERMGSDYMQLYKDVIKRG